MHHYWSFSLKSEKMYLEMCIEKVVNLFEQHLLQLPLHQLNFFKNGMLERIIDADHNSMCFFFI